MSSMSSPGRYEDEAAASDTSQPEVSPVDSLPDDMQMDAIRRYFAHKLMFYESDGASFDETLEEPVVQVLDELSVDGIIKYIQSEKCKNIITLAGAGISTSAGIPDFRSPGSGLYHNLQKYNLPEPQAIFDISYFKENPEPFFMLAKELLPGSFKPTISHYFIKLLKEKGLLLRHYTQNIDTLERVAGLPDSHLVEAHGSFHTSHCIHCRKEHKIHWKKHFAECYPETKIPICTDCPGVVKPDIVFFGEKLPDRFHDCIRDDFDRCDLLIIMGSSLEVQPFASLIDRVPAWCPRLLINRERAGVSAGVLEARARAALASLAAGAPQLAALASLSGLHGLLAPGGLRLDSPDNVRDLAWLGDCDNGCQMIADKLGWGEELSNMMRMEHEKIDLQDAEENNSHPLTPVSPVMPHLQPPSL